MKNCVKCKQPVGTNASIGRNKSYCSVACRRAAELEIRRINERLGSLEKIAEDYRLKLPVLSIYGKEDDVLAEISRQENRLKELFSGLDAIHHLPGAE